MKKPYLLIGGGVALVAACACAMAVIAVAAGLVYYGQTAAVTPAATLNPTQVVETMDEIQAFVITTRGLQAEAPVERQFLTVDEVRQRVLDDFEEDTSPEEVADDVRVMAAFGLVEPELDLYDLLVRLHSEGVAGFYDPDTQELVIVSENDGGFNVYEQTVFVHEYTHALQDQVFGIRASGFSEEMWDTDPERAAAIQAVLEGDASLLEEQYMDTLSAAERRQYNAAIDALDTSIYLEVPEFLLRTFLFPYREGLAFVERYYDADGWAGIDALWQNPPVSTEHILHPERYEAGDLPVIVARPALTETLGSGWQQLDAHVNGEWYTYLILAYGVDDDARVSESEAERAAEGWGGDSYVFYFNAATGERLLAAHWVWDSESDAKEFAAAFREYGRQRFGSEMATVDAEPARDCWSGDEIVCLITQGQGTLWLMAPDTATLEAVLGQYPDFQ